MGWRKLYFLECLSGREANTVGKNEALRAVKGVVMGNLYGLGSSNERCC